MAEPVFIDGVPARITPADIVRWHLDSFPDLSEPEHEQKLYEAIDAVYTMFHGCQTLFDWHPEQVYFDKTQFLFRMLACWYLASQYPSLVAGTTIMGGLALKSKKIGSVHLTFADINAEGGTPGFTDLLGMLKLNPWGAKAYMMIQSAGKRISLGGRRS